MQYDIQPSLLIKDDQPGFINRPNKDILSPEEWDALLLEK
jgi:hypothetical protein